MGGAGPQPSYLAARDIRLREARAVSTAGSEEQWSPGIELRIGTAPR